MLAITALQVRSATESVARSALPGAAVQVPVAVPVAAPRRVAADRLRALADRLAPEPTAERTHWQGA